MNFSKILLLLKILYHIGNIYFIYTLYLFIVLIKRKSIYEIMASFYISYFMNFYPPLYNSHLCRRVDFLFFYPCCFLSQNYRVS